MNEPAFACRVYGYPVPWKRLKTRIARGAQAAKGFVQHYPAPENVDWKRTIQAQIQDRKPAKLLDGPLSIRLVFILPRPKSAPKRVTHHITRPDTSNLLKAVEDALHGIVYWDDSQLVEAYARKDFGDPPGVDIEIRAMEPVQAVTAPSEAAQESLL